MKLYKIYMYVLKSYVEKIIERIRECSIVICALFVQLFKCLPDSMDLKLLTGTLDALIGENPYGSE